jgi:hypothetical protein
MVQDVKGCTQATKARQTITTIAEGVSTLISNPTEDMELPTEPASTTQTKEGQIVSMELNFNQENYRLLLVLFRWLFHMA